MTFGQILTILKKRGDVVRADQMLREVTMIATIMAKQLGLSSVIPEAEKLEAELHEAPMDQILLLIEAYKKQNRSVPSHKSVQSVNSRVGELRGRGWHVTVGVAY